MGQFGQFGQGGKVVCSKFSDHPAQIVFRTNRTFGTKGTAKKDKEKQILNLKRRRKDRI